MAVYLRLRNEMVISVDKDYWDHFMETLISQHSRPVLSYFEDSSDDLIIEKRKKGSILKTHFEIRRNFACISFRLSYANIAECPSYVRIETLELFRELIKSGELYGYGYLVIFMYRDPSTGIIRPYNNSLKPINPALCSKTDVMRSYNSKEALMVDALMGGEDLQ